MPKTDNDNTPINPHETSGFCESREFSFHNPNVKFLCFEDEELYQMLFDGKALNQSVYLSIINIPEGKMQFRIVIDNTIDVIYPVVNVDRNLFGVSGLRYFELQHFVSLMLTLGYSGRFVLEKSLDEVVAQCLIFYKSTSSSYCDFYENTMFKFSGSDVKLLTDGFSQLIFLSITNIPECKLQFSIVNIKPSVDLSFPVEKIRDGLFIVHRLTYSDLYEIVTLMKILGYNGTIQLEKILDEN